jgi:uncharacterized integral membrane protein
LSRRIRFSSFENICNNNNSIYLRANLTAQRPITKRARVEKNQTKYKNKAIIIIIIIIIIITIIVIVIVSNQSTSDHATT